MPNMKNIVNTHKKKMINPPDENITRACNCIRKHQCPLNEECLTNNILHRASITPNVENSKRKIYYGVSETAFKLRLILLKSLMQMENQTQLLVYSKYNV